MAKEKIIKREIILLSINFRESIFQVSPSKALGMFDALAYLKEKYSGKKLLLVGFAETATAIGAEIAIKLIHVYSDNKRDN